MAFLSDGIGLSYADIAEELARKSKTIVAQDDPIMMMVPLCNAFLAEESKLMERHKTALAQVMADKTDSFVQSVQQTVDELGKTLASEAVQSLQAAFVAQHEAMVKNASALAKHKSNKILRLPNRIFGRRKPRFYMKLLLQWQRIHLKRTLVFEPLLMMKQVFI